jgi:hypothetical protein
VSLPEATDVTESLWRAAVQLFERTLTDQILPMRLMGVGAFNLSRDGIVQGQLFGDDERKRGEALDRTIDAIRTRQGSDAIRRGSTKSGGPGA